MPIINKLWKDPVWSTVIATILLAVGAYLLTWLPIEYIEKYIQEIGTLFVSQTLLSNWFILILFILSAITLIGLLAWIWASVFPPAPDWHTYLTDEFFGVRWRWIYFQDAHPKNLTIFCPTCDLQLEPKGTSLLADNVSTWFYCEDCKTQWGEYDKPYDSIEIKAVLFIQQKIRSGKWRLNDK